MRSEVEEAASAGAGGHYARCKVDASAARLVRRRHVGRCCGRSTAADCIWQSSLLISKFRRRNLGDGDSRGRYVETWIAYVADRQNLPRRELELLGCCDSDGAVQTLSAVGCYDCKSWRRKRRSCKRLLIGEAGRSRGRKDLVNP